MHSLAHQKRKEVKFCTAWAIKKTYRSNTKQNVFGFQSGLDGCRRLKWKSLENFHTQLPGLLLETGDETQLVQNLV